MTYVLTALIEAITLGSIYAMMTAGLTLVYGTVHALNMAHGSILMIGGFGAWFVSEQLGWNVGLGLVSGVVIAVAVGAVVDRVSIRPLVGRRGSDFEMVTFISTFAVSLLVGVIALQVFGPRQKQLAPLFPGQIDLGNGTTMPYHNVAVVIAALAALGALEWFLKKTRYGIGIVASSEELDAARLVGINPRRLYSVTFAIGAALAGLAGVLLGPIYYVSPDAGDAPMLLALIIAIVGGLGSMRGTIYAAYGVGIVQAVCDVTIGEGWYLAILYGLIVVLLMFRPNGIAGRAQEARL